MVTPIKVIKDCESRLQTKEYLVQKSLPKELSIVGGQKPRISMYS